MVMRSGSVVPLFIYSIVVYGARGVEMVEHFSRVGYARGAPSVAAGGPPAERAPFRSSLWVV